MAELVVEDLVKRFGPVTAVDGVSFTVREGEFLTLLGPSGCGKSTTLAAIAGLDLPDAGRIRAGSTVFFDSGKGIALPPERRNVGLVFQSYALWPHMTVEQNLAFPLSLRKVPKAEQGRRIDEILTLVEMREHKGRYPHQLSGGQQQRVALARTLVYEPELLLLDEPLSNLDAKLRDRARTWLRQLQTRIGVTTIYVTHDQVEALALSDRIAVMHNGRILQLAPPEDVYERPSAPFVADFIGTSNFFRGEVKEHTDGIATIALADGQELRARSREPVAAGEGATVAVRPERITLRPGAPALGGEAGLNRLHGRLLSHSYLGARHEAQVEVAGTTIRVETDEAVQGETVTVEIGTDAGIVFRRGAGEPEQRA